MRLTNSKLLSGYEFVQEVIGRNRFRAGDCLVSADGGECQWLEFKAVVGVGGNDKKVQQRCENGESVEDACETETRKNLQRIAKSILSFHNTRGGCILIGVCEENGIGKPTVYSASRNRDNQVNASRFGSIFRYLQAFFKGVVSAVKDLKLLRTLDSLYRLMRTDGNADRRLQLDHFFERKIIFYKSIPIIALLVKRAENQNGVILYEEETKGGYRLTYRKGADDQNCVWPLSVDDRQLFDEVWNEAYANDDLYLKIVSLFCKKRLNPLMKMLARMAHLIDKSFVSRTVSYIFAPVAREKLYVRMKISFLYYGIYFLILNALLIWSLGSKVVELIAIYLGLGVGFYEIGGRIKGLKLCGWTLIPSVFFILLSSVAPSSPCAIYASSIGLVVSCGVISLMLKSSWLKTDNESVLSQIVTLFVYLSVTIVQYPFIRFAISDSGRSLICNHTLAFAVNLIPVISSIVASRIAIVYYDGFVVGCLILFYLPYVLLFICALFSCGSEIVVVPKKIRGIIMWLCPKVIMLSVIGLFYMVIISIGAVRDADNQKRWNREIQTSKTHKNNVVNDELAVPKGGESVRAEHGVGAKKEENRKGYLTINDYFAQAFASYYYCYSNDVSRIFALGEQIGNDVCNRRYKLVLARHYKGLKNIEYSFIGSIDDDECEDESFAFEEDEEDFDEEDYFDDFLSNKKLDVDGRIMTLFREYAKAIRQDMGLSDDGREDVGKSFNGKANDIRLRLFDQFEAMKLQIDWRYIKWINRPRE